jgi:predicted deacylase
MLDAFGFTIVNEYPVKKYIDDDLHRSTSGAVLLKGRFPAFTVELGGGQMPDKAIVTAAVAGTRNVLRWAGMLLEKWNRSAALPSSTLVILCAARSGSECRSRALPFISNNLGRSCRG